MDVNENLEKRARGGWGIVHHIIYMNNDLITNSVNNFYSNFLLEYIYVTMEF